MRHISTAIAILLAAGSAWAQGSDRSHRQAHERSRKSIVGVRAMAPLGERSGTGVFLDEKGTILLSYSTCPKGARKIRVWTEGPRLYTQKAGEIEIIGHSERDEITLLRLKPKKGREIHPVEFGSSRKIRVGDVSYTSGNAANSIINDNQPSFHIGLVSSIYRLDEPRANSTYTGLVIETSAAVNVGMEGAPLLNREGKMVGMVTLNFSPHRFLGCAIPTDGLRPVLERMQKEAAGDSEPAKAAKGLLGIGLRERNGRLIVVSIERNGPADKAGIRKGDAVVAIGRTPLSKVGDFWDRVRKLQVGAILWLWVEAEGERFLAKIILEEKPK